MEDTRIILSGIWVATMLTFLLGDVLRIFAGDFEPGKVAGGMQATQGMRFHLCPSGVGAPSTVDDGA